MAENNVEPEQYWSDRALDTAEDTLVAMETLLATLRAFEDVLRQQEISIASSTEYCDNFCQALMHYAGSRNSMEHGLPLLEVYCLSINCFGAARSHLTAESDRVALVLKRLALSCFELLLSVPENEIPYEAWVQFHHSVQISHDTLLQFGSTDLQALLQITGEGGAWSNPVLTSLLTGQPTNPEEVDAYISLEGEGFMEMRVKHLEKMGEVAKAVVLAKACTECSFISNQATFRQTYVSLLCHLLPNEEAITEISRLDCKDVLEITCNLETEGEENTAFILCTTFLTQQLQQQSLYCSWELTLLWSKLQRRIDPSLMSLLERCLQLGAIAKTVHHLLCLVRVIQTETEEMGVPASVELCVKALQLPKLDDSETRISVCKTVSCLLPGDLEVLRACLLTEFLLGPSQEVFGSLKELYLRPDQKYDQENEVIPNSLRCELLLALKAYWPFDPEFWDWKTLKYHCVTLLGLMPESEGEEEEAVDKREKGKQHEPQGITVKVESEHQKKINGSLDGHEQQDKKQSSNLPEIQGESATKKHKFCCQICMRSVTDTQIIHHSKRHAEDNRHPCPVCLKKFKSRKELVPHLKEHVQSETHLNKNNIKKEDGQKQVDEDDDIEPGEITIDPSLMQFYKSTHDPEVLHHIVQQAKTLKEKNVDDDEHITFEYIDQHFSVQNRDEYPCPGTGCTRTFKHSKYLYVHLKSEHKESDSKEPKAMMTLVAVCFDGSKFTCGFEKCGMTFSRARDVQRHLKCAHPEHLKLENKAHKHDKERDSKSKGIKTETEPEGVEKGKDEQLTPFQPVEAGKERKVANQPQNNETLQCFSSLQTENDALSEILIGLSKLDLNSSSPHSVPSEPPLPDPESNASQISLHQAIMAKPPVVLLQKRPPHPPEEKIQVKTKKASAADEERSVESLATAKPYICEMKGCSFRSAQSYSLMRHYNIKHGRTVEQARSPEVRKEPAKKRHPPNSDEPQPQYKCHFANCSASYHLKSSLVRHTRDSHSQPPELIRCKFEGCTKVFSHDDALKKHMIYSHCEDYDSLVVCLQSTHKKSVTGCQKKLIVTPPQSPQKEEPVSTTTQVEGSSPKPQVTAQSEEMGEEAAVKKKVSGERKRERYSYSRYVFRSHEEALQMCQDRCMRVAYPCMVQDCDSVVRYIGSLHRHYMSVHSMRRKDLVKNEEKLVFNAEQLEELIQRESARPTVTGACSPNGVRKMEYQAEPENTEGLPAPMSLHSIKADIPEEDDHDPLGFPEEKEEEPPSAVRNGVLVGADEVLYGEPSTGGHTEDSAAATQNSPKQEERLSLDKIKPLLRPLTVDLSPPCSLRFTADEGFQNVSGTKDGGKMYRSALLPAPPVRQPLKRKNELSGLPLNLKDTQPCSPSQRTFDIDAYKPMGFESSFLRFIQETTPKDKNALLVKRRDSFRRSCSVKENNQLGISHSRSRRTHSPLLKPHAMTGDFTSVQNLKSILDKALTGCGDLAIKQLQYLRPVVVLGRPVCTTTTTLPDLFPSDTNNSKLLLGS
ncbi:hypothetical protein EPR50_G00205350 [Perca flavescens]|uniref:C2H2-type domain-containing protein n=1 Tax=Perca flavescens TaxID=8167 RepID=A0A484C4F4_PERFV|nr:hypothetical protein EPR50_G00205350 [Perca flavescens]